VPCLRRFAYTSYRPYTTLFRKLQQEHALGVHGQEEGQQQVEQQQEQQQEEQPAADAQQAEQGTQAAVEKKPAGAADSGGSGAGSTNSSSSSSSNSSSSSRKLRGRATPAEPLSLPATVPNLDPLADDAFGTIMAWLHSRIEATR
jgi:hypothetical protein